MRYGRGSMRMILYLEASRLRESGRAMFTPANRLLSQVRARKGQLLPLPPPTMTTVFLALLFLSDIKKARRRAGVNILACSGGVYIYIQY